MNSRKGRNGYGLRDSETKDQMLLRSLFLHLSSLHLSKCYIYSPKLAYLTEWGTWLPVTPDLYPKCSKTIEENEGRLLSIEIWKNKK